MSTEAQTPTAVPFHEFWSWLKHHFNCVVRVGGPDFTLFDMPDVHWHLEEEHEAGLCVVQAYRTKVLCGEMLLRPDEIAYVQMVPEDDELVLFECITETPEGLAPLYHVLMAHGMDAHDRGPNSRWAH